MYLAGGESLFTQRCLTDLVAFTSKLTGAEALLIPHHTLSHPPARNDKQDLRALRKRPASHTILSCAQVSRDLNCSLNLKVHPAARGTPYCTTPGMRAAAKVISTDAGRQNVLAHQRPNRRPCTRDGPGRHRFMAGTASEIAWLWRQKDKLKD
jgi:hypothetical protein